MQKRTTIALFLISAAAIAGSAYAGYVSLGNAKRPSPDTIAVTRGDVRRTASVAGKVRASQDVSLSFERGGVVSRVSAAVGDRVRAG